MIPYRYPGLENGRRFEFECVICGAAGVSPNKACNTCPPESGRKCRALRAKQRDVALKLRRKGQVFR